MVVGMADLEEETKEVMVGTGGETVEGSEAQTVAAAAAAMGVAEAGLLVRRCASEVSL